MATSLPPKQTIEEKLATAGEFKDAGNEFYKAKDFKAAAGALRKRWTTVSSCKTTIEISCSVEHIITRRQVPPSYPLHEGH